MPRATRAAGDDREAEEQIPAAASSAAVFIARCSQPAQSSGAIGGVAITPSSCSEAAPRAASVSAQETAPEMAAAVAAIAIPSPPSQLAESLTFMSASQAAVLSQHKSLLPFVAQLPCWLPQRLVSLALFGELGLKALETSRRRPVPSSERPNSPMCTRLSLSRSRPSASTAQFTLARKPTSS